MRQTYDAVVIGSGFGGAITACRLAQAGQSVCLLGAGPRRRKTIFHGLPLKSPAVLCVTSPAVRVSSNTGPFPAWM